MKTINDVENKISEIAAKETKSNKNNTQKAIDDLTSFIDFLYGQGDIDNIPKYVLAWASGISDIIVKNDNELDDAIIFPQTIGNRTFHSKDEIISYILSEQEVARYRLNNKSMDPDNMINFLRKECDLINYKARTQENVIKTLETEIRLLREILSEVGANFESTSKSLQRDRTAPIDLFSMHSTKLEINVKEVRVYIDKTFYVDKYPCEELNRINIALKATEHEDK